MSIVLVIIAAALVAYLVRWWRHSVATRAVLAERIDTNLKAFRSSDRGASPSGGTADDRADDTPVPTFRVVSLGVAGTGKTVLLASMFKQLQLRRPGRSYRLETGEEERVHLGQLYTELIDTEQPWPRGTQGAEARTFDFDVVASSGPSRQEVLRIRYLDYAGEVLERTGDDVDPGHIAELERHISAAHALFGVIDGQLLVEYLRDEPRGIRYMDGSLMAMLGFLGRGSAPIHFLVTKWDLVRDIGEIDDHHETRLGMVRRALLDHPDISALVRSDDLEDRSIRLIPVSAVGDGFAETRPDGTVAKIRGARADPYHLDLPFAAVAQDYCTQLAAALTAEDEVGLRSSAAARRKLPTGRSIETALRLISAGAQSTIRLALGSTAPVAALAVEPVADVFFDWVSRPAIHQPTDEERLNEAELEWARLRSIRAGVLDDFEKSLWAFENEHPSSVLRRGPR